MTFAAPVRIVELDDAAESSWAVSLGHRLHQLVLEQPGGVVGDAQLAPQRQGGDAVLVLRQQVHRQEPGPQRQLGLGEQCAAGRRDLMLAPIALQDIAPLS